MTALDITLAVIAVIGFGTFAFGPAILFEVHLREMRKDEADHQAWLDTLPDHMKRGR